MPRCSGCQTRRDTVDLDAYALLLVKQLAPIYTARQAREWLRSPQALLDGQVPMDLVRVGKVEDVQQVIARLLDCVYI